MALVNIKKLNNLVSQGYLHVEKHPVASLYLYHYTPLVENEGHWIPEIKICCGLVVSEEGFIVSRPIEKYFSINSENLKNLSIRKPNEPYEITIQKDGYTILVTRYKNELIISGENTFKADYIDEARDIIINHRPPKLFQPRQTCVFELVSPKFTKTIKYPGSGLWLKTIIFNKSGKEVLHGRIMSDLNIPMVIPTIPKHIDVFDLPSLTSYNEKGFIIHYLGTSNSRYEVLLNSYKRRLNEGL